VNATGATGPVSLRTLPFDQGRAGGLSPAVDFSRFLSMKDPREAEVVQQLPMLLDYLQTGQFGEFTGEKGVPIRYGVWAPPPDVAVKGVVNLVFGRTESFSKYAELLFNLRDLRAQGYVIAAMDPRTQGFSGRELTSDPQKQVLGDFEDFVRDELTFHDVLERHFPDVPEMMAGHSMGGAIATRYLEEHPNDYQRSMLMSPMLEVAGHVDILGKRLLVPGPIETVVEEIGGTLAPTAYGPGQKPWRPWTLDDGLTHSQARLDAMNAISEVFPETKVGGAAWSWLKQAAEADRAMMRPEELAKLKGLDVHLMSARDDAWVVPAAEDKAALIAGIPQTNYPGMRHELLNETDEGRDRALAQLRGFITSMKTA
jgi:lysophospholipase